MQALEKDASKARLAEQIWVLRRPLSASPKLLFAFMGSLALVCLIIASVWAYLGASWVLVFAGIDVLALALATTWCVRHALDEERLCLDGEQLRVSRTLAGHTENWALSRYFVRVQAVEVKWGPFTRMRLKVSAQNNAILVGGFCDPKRLKPLEKALTQALRAPAHTPANS